MRRHIFIGKSAGENRPNLDRFLQASPVFAENLTETLVSSRKKDRSQFPAENVEKGPNGRARPAHPGKAPEKGVPPQGRPSAWGLKFLRAEKHHKIQNVNEGNRDENGRFEICVF